MRAYEYWVQWKAGLAVADYRYVARVCNIDVSNLATASDSSDTSANILKFMSQAQDLLPPNGAGRPVFYMNNRVLSMLRVKLLDKGNLALQYNDVMGASMVAKKQLEFFGIPCRRIDKITNAEATIDSATT